MRVQASITVNHGMTVSEFNKALAVVPDDAKISINTYRGDRPGETSCSTITFSWELK